MQFNVDFIIYFSGSQGVVVSGVMTVVMTWCVGLRGPLYVSAFNPLMLIFVAIAGCLMLDENLYLGRYVYCVTGYLYASSYIYYFLFLIK